MPNAGQTRNGNVLQREVEARLVTQIMVTTQDMVTDANLLLHLSNAHLHRIQRRTGLIVSAVVAGMGLFVLLNLGFATRSVLSPIRALQRGAEIVGAGNLGYRTSIQLDNEIGELSRAFDGMTAKLEQTQAELEANAHAIAGNGKRAGSVQLFGVARSARAAARHRRLEPGAAGRLRRGCSTRKRASISASFARKPSAWGS